MATDIRLTIYNLPYLRKGIVKYATQNYNDYNVGKGPMYRWERGQMVEKT